MSNSTEVTDRALVAKRPRKSQLLEYIGGSHERR